MDLTSAGEAQITIVGAGLGGAAMAIYLGRRGFTVDVYEHRGDPRAGSFSGPSMNLGLSRRGIEALARLGLAEAMVGQAIPMLGRVVHDRDGRVSHQPYGGRSGQVIHAIQRREIGVGLIAAADALDNVRFVFDRRCLEIDKGLKTATFRDERSRRQEIVPYRVLIGADGVFSTVRHWMQRGERADYQQEFLDWGWKELRIPPGPGGAFPLEKNAFHLWPRGSCLLFAHPNRDGSFTCSFVLPFEGEPSFASLASGGEVTRFFAATFGDIAPLIPDLAEQFARNPIVKLVTTRTSQWHHRGDIVLVGDAAHAVVPFYAQGMNAALEDCAVLDDCIARHGGDWEGAFAEYQELRRGHADALAEVSKQNFLELADRVRSPLLRARKRLDLWLSRRLDDRWTTLHARITHTCIPYADAVALARRQDRILGWVGAGLALLAASAVFYLLRGLF
jgi:kynurenine 3-monooxygenase